MSSNAPTSSYRARAGHPRWMRRVALGLSCVFAWTAALAAPIQALAQNTPVSAHKPLPPLPKGKGQVPPASLRENSPPRTTAQFQRYLAQQKPEAALSLLDQSGHLAHFVAQDEVSEWIRELHSDRVTPAAAAQLHVWLGEWQLAKNEQPQTAIQHFQLAKKLAAPTNAYYGMAAYDTAIALFL